MDRWFSQTQLSDSTRKSIIAEIQAMMAAHYRNDKNTWDNSTLLSLLKHAAKEKQSIKSNSDLAHL